MQLNGITTGNIQSAITNLFIIVNMTMAKTVKIKCKKQSIFLCSRIMLHIVQSHNEMT